MRVVTWSRLQTASRLESETSLKSSGRQTYGSRLADFSSLGFMKPTTQPHKDANDGSYADSVNHSLTYRVIVCHNALRRTGRLLTRAGKSSGFKLIHTYRISILNLTTAQETTTDQNAKLKLIS
ncbi:hypothetical protein DPX16_5816 [Anabarilius grahami]|uniref:Uncharacterized protein n=1 Tax=Anabarilius grahami TaxID=495550 RepID=A0A3N0YV32_ANAGA|nr:hypothetical protein DPX16_5816 [Anabarilius grahami]